MKNIYEQHEKAFKRVASYVVLRNGEPVAKINIKYPADGVGRLYAYVHWFGEHMTRGFAYVYGYDKASAACYDAVRKCKPVCTSHALFIQALKDDEHPFDYALIKAGFNVFQAI